MDCNDGSWVEGKHLWNTKQIILVFIILMVSKLHPILRSPRLNRHRIKIALAEGSIDNCTVSQSNTCNQMVKKALHFKNLPIKVIHVIKFGPSILLHQT